MDEARVAESGLVGADDLLPVRGDLAVGRFAFDAGLEVLFRQVPEVVAPLHDHVFGGDGLARTKWCTLPSRDPYGPTVVHGVGRCSDDVAIVHRSADVQVA